MLVDFMDAAGAADVLVDGGTPFIIHAAGAADLGVEVDAGVDLGRARAGDLHFCRFRFEVEAVGVGGACQVEVGGFGLTLQVDVAAAGDFGGDMGRVDFHLHIAGAADVHFEVFGIGNGCLANDIAVAGDVNHVIDG